MSNVKLFVFFLLVFLPFCCGNLLEFLNSFEDLEQRFLQLPETPELYKCNKNPHDHQHLLNTYKQSMDRTNFWLNLPLPNLFQLLILTNQINQLEKQLHKINQLNRKYRQFVRQKIRKILRYPTGPIFYDRHFNNLPLALYSAEQLTTVREALDCIGLKFFVKQPINNSIDSLVYFTLKLSDNETFFKYFGDILDFLCKQKCTIDAIAEQFNPNFDLESNCPPLRRKDVINGPVTFAVSINEIKSNCLQSNSKKRLKNCLKTIRKLHEWIRTDLVPNQIRNNYESSIRTILEPNGYGCYLNSKKIEQNQLLANCTLTQLNPAIIENFKSARQLAIVQTLIRQANRCVLGLGYRNSHRNSVLNWFHESFAKRSEIFNSPIRALVKQPWPTIKPNIFVACYRNDDQRIARNVSLILQRFNLINSILNATNLIDFAS